MIVLVPGATITKYHRLGSLKKKFNAPQSCSWKSEIKVLAETHSLSNSTRGSFLSYSIFWCLLANLVMPWLVDITLWFLPLWLHDHLLLESVFKCSSSNKCWVNVGLILTWITSMGMTFRIWTYLLWGILFNLSHQWQLGSQSETGHYLLFQRIRPKSNQV